MPAKRHVVSPQGGGQIPLTGFPVFSPVGGSYASPQTVAITSGTFGASIFYTTDGSTPTIASTLYSGPISVPSTETVQAVAKANGYLLSSVASAAYTITSPQTATPTFSPVAGSYIGTQSVVISCTTPSSSIFYTLDGSTPTPASTAYVSAISVVASETIKAIATAAGFTQSAVGSAAYVISAPVSSAQLIKFMPGDTMSASYNGGTVNYVDGANLYPVSADVNNALSICLRANHANVRAFRAWFRAPALEPTQGNYTFDGSATDPILAAYKACQAEYRRALGGLADQGIFEIAIGNGTNTGGSNSTPAQIATFTFAGSQGPAAPWIRDCVINGNSETYNGHTVGFIDVFNTVGASVQANGPTTWTPGGATTRYPLAIQAGASQQCGYGYAGWTGSQFVTVYPTFWEVGHGKARQNFWKALLQFYKLPYTNSSGVTQWFTLNDHPMIGFVGWLDETSPGWQSGVKPVSSDAINYPNGNFLSATGFWAEYYAWLAIVSAAAPRLQIGVSWNFVITTGAGDDDTPSTFNSRFADLVANGWRNIVLCGPDTVSASFNGASWSATTAQQNFIGVVPAVAGSGTITPALSYQGKIGMRAQVQSPDWSSHVLGGSGNNNSITNGQNIILIANGHSNTIGQLTFCAGNRDWYFESQQFLTSDWPGFIFPSFSSTFGQTTNPVYTRRATGLMAPVVINAVAVASSSSFTITWTPFVLDPFETGLTYTLFENGVSIATGLTSGTFTRTGRSTATPYSYTMAMANTNGTGPQGAALIGEIAGSQFNFANFAGAPATINLTSVAAFSGNVINITNGQSHNGGCAWYKTLQNIQAFTTSFNFLIPAGTPAAGNYGFVFCIQNTNNTTNPFAFGVNSVPCSANGIGYGAGGGSGQPSMGNSVGLVFNTNLFNNDQGFWYVGPQPWSAIGLCVDGGPAIGGGTFGTTNGNGFAPLIDTHPMGLNVGSGNPINCVLTYDGTTLVMVATDTVSLATTRLSWPINIPAIVGANTAFIGFMATSPQTTNLDTQALSWAYSTGINTRLAAPTFSVPAGQYSGTQTVALSGPGSIYYTTNGFPPSPGGAGSALYSAPITVSSSKVIQAVAVQSGFTDSPVSQVLYSIQASGPVINFPSGFASAGGLVQLTGNATLSGSNLALVDTTAHAGDTFESAGAWFATPVQVSTFSTTFTLNLSSVGTAFVNGLCFVLQNYPQTTTGTNFNWGLGNGPFGVTVVSGGPYTLGSPANGQSNCSLGYVQIFSSIGVAFDLSTNTVGLYTNGAFPTGSQVAITGGVSLQSATAIAITIAYNGTALTLSMHQGANTFNLTLSASINIPTIVGASSAWAGFTAANGFAVSNLQLSNWTM